MYDVFIDKPTTFECDIQIKNATLKNSIARLILESNDGPNLVFNGKIENDKCIIPIKRLKGMLDENVRGNIHLEIIVEDTFFKPWTDTFSVKEHTSVKVKVNEQKQSFKPTVRLKTHPILNYVEGKTSELLPSAKRKGINIFVPKKEIAMLCEHFGIRKYNFHKKQKEFVQILREYFKANPEYNYHVRTILNRIDDFLR